MVLVMALKTGTKAGTAFLPVFSPTETFLHDTSYGAEKRREGSELTKVLLLDTAVFIT